MFYKKYLHFKAVWSDYKPSERLFFFFSMLIGFFINAEYAIIRPVSNSVFLSAYGPEALPMAWLAALPLGFLSVSFYNYFLPKWGCFKLFFVITSSISLVNTLCSFWITQFPSLAFFFYVWKEIYIMLMFHQLWSLVHTVTSQERARYLYGFLFGVGALGSIFGSFFPSLFAVFIGSEKLLLATPFIYFVLLFCYKRISFNVSFASQEKPSFYKGAQQVFLSKHLRFILFLVLFMQLAVSLIDFQFNQKLATTILDTDLRTAYFAKIMTAVHSVTLLMQLFGSYFLIRCFNLKGCHFFIPCLLLINGLLAIVFPVFGLMAFSFSVVKIFDFSLFSIVKEMLYIPLKQEEKFQAKAFIDIFAFRASKTLGAICIFLFSIHIHWIHCVLLLMWCFLILWALERKVSFTRPII
jgi:ATP:ADP antiporter, AAA family